MENYVHTVKYYECDRMGVTHHSNYIRFMEEARIYVLDQLGWGFEKMEANGIVSPVVSLSVEYKRTTTFPDAIEVEVKVKDMTPLKLTFSYVMRCGGKVVFTGSSVHCFMDKESYRPIVMSERYPELWGIFEKMKEER